MPSLIWRISLCLLAAALLPRPAVAETAMRVAVLEFGNASSEAGLEALGKGLQSMVTTDLSRVGSITLVERSRIQEIVAEQKLGNSGLMDKATAAKIGKLAGASHLLGGTFTCVSKSMRLDARLFSVQTGEVLLANEMTGERDAFFELEKSLVNKLIATLGVKLEPKERASIAKIHTADFGAFKSFSQGVAAFDAKNYDDALESLRAAMKADADFSLARVTLDEYEAVVAKIRARAQNIELTTRKAEAAKKDADFDNDSRVAEKLAAIANEPGDAARMRRLAALTYLMGFYNQHGRNHGRISRFQDHYDQLVVRRRLDGLARRYIAESQKAFPDAPLFSTGMHPPDTPELVEERIKGLAGSLKQGLEYQAANRNRGLINNLTHVEEFFYAMAADRHEIVKILEIVCTQLQALKAEEYERTRMLEALAEAYLDVGDVDAASGALARASAIETSADDLKQMAARVEELGKVSALLAKTDKKAELRELVACGDRNASQLQKYFAAPGPASVELGVELARKRELQRWWPHRDQFYLWSGEVAHLIAGEWIATAGPRADCLATKALHYYKGERTDGKDLLIALGRGPRAEVDASFELNFKRGDDFLWVHAPRKMATAAEWQPDPGRPEVTLVFGLRDVDTDNVYDPDQRKNFYASPTQAYGVRIAPAGVALVHLGEDAPSESLRKPVMTTKVLAEATKPVDGDKVKVRVAVKGRSVSATVGSSTHTFALPEDAPGFVGFHVRGQGYVKVSELQVRP